MYIPGKFRFEDKKEILKFIQTYNFGIIISDDSARPLATHLPFMVQEENGELRLISHFARANPHWQHLKEEEEVLVIFQGPHAYISPSWYKDQQTVPTWNYAAVHVYGKPKVIHDVEDLKKMVTELTLHHEKEAESDWEIEKGKSTIDKIIRGITGVIIEVTEIQGKLKFNQNRSEADREGVIQHVPDDQVKLMMQNLKDQKS